MVSAYGYDLPKRAVADTLGFFTSSWIPFVLFWAVSSGLSIWGFHKRDERRQLLRDAFVGALCGVGGAAAVFAFQLFFGTPYGMFVEQRDRADKAEQVAREAVKKVGEATSQRPVDPASGEAVQERVAARQRHLERLREALLADSKTLTGFSKTVAEYGYAVAPHNQNFDADEREMWGRHTLVGDFATHFPAYGQKRGEVRALTRTQDVELRNLLRRVSAKLEWPFTEDVGHRDQIAGALVHQCARDGFGFRLELMKGGGYGYSYSSGGGGSNGGQSPPSYLVAQDRAFRAFRPDASFTSTCGVIKKRAVDLERQLTALSGEVAVLAESTVLKGDCDYLR
jgi:hypothetical protein